MRSLSKFIAILVIAFAFSACKKSSTPAPDTTVTTTMTLTSNGTNIISFDDCEEVTASVDNAAHTLIAGYSTTNKNTSFSLDIVHDVSTLKAGQAYPVATSFGQKDAATLFYYPDATGNFSTQPANAQGSVTISSVTATTITGTFSGKLFAVDDVDGTTVIYTITNGAFTAKRN